jgi:hypothetical protein
VAAVNRSASVCLECRYLPRKNPFKLLLLLLLLLLLVLVLVCSFYQADLSELQQMSIKSYSVVRT